MGRPTPRDLPQGTAWFPPQALPQPGLGRRLSITMCSRPGDSAHTPVNSKARANRRGYKPALAATVLVTNLSAGRGPSRPHALSLKVEAIVVHDLVPRSHEGTHELLLRVLLCVNFGDGSELGVVAEDEVDGGAGPLHRAGAIATLVHVRSRGGWLPL